MEWTNRWGQGGYGLMGGFGVGYRDCIGLKSWASTIIGGLFFLYRIDFFYTIPFSNFPKLPLLINIQIRNPQEIDGFIIRKLTDS